MAKSKIFTLKNAAIATGVVLVGRSFLKKKPATQTIPAPAPVPVKTATKANVLDTNSNLMVSSLKGPRFV